MILESSETKIIQFAKELFEQWKDRDDIKVERLTGITNITFRVYTNDKTVTPQQIIGRSFGKTVENIFV